MADINGARVFISCENFDCASKHSKDLDQVNLWSESSHDIFAEGGRYYGKCLVCENVRSYKYKAPTRFLGAPDFSTGKVFGSRHEQRDYAKKNGLREL